MAYNTFAKTLLLVTLLASQVLYAQTTPATRIISEEELFRRVYATVVGEIPPASDPLLAQVRSGSKTAVNASMELIAKANLVPIASSQLTTAQRAVITPPDPNIAYTPYTLNSIDDVVAKKILNTFQRMHQNFFTTKDFSGVPAFSWWADLFNDPTEGATMYTNILFSGLPYDSIVKGTTTVRAIRSLGAWIRTYFVGGSNIWNISVPGTGLERGELIGVGRYTTNGLKTWLTSTGVPVVTLPGVYSGGASFQAERHIGAGGILGSSSYFFVNSGFPTVGRNDDPSQPNVMSAAFNLGHRAPRRLVSEFMKTFMCRSIPVLRDSDVTGLVASYLSSNPNPATHLAFRKSTSCMSCHATTDLMSAAGLRQFHHYQTSGGTPWTTAAQGAQNLPGTVFVVRQSKWSDFGGYLASEPYSGLSILNSPRDPSASRRPNRGQFFMRGYDGTLYSQTISATNDVDGLTQLGQAIANTNDLYTCAASRYFEFFTGITVSLQDVGDPRFVPLTQDDLEYRSIVHQLGISLKTHQNLQQLIREIISLPLYKTRSLRKERP